MPHIPMNEIIEIADKSEWDKLRFGSFFKTRDHVENSLIRFPFPCIINAYCGSCGEFHNMEITGRHGVISPNGHIILSFSEGVVCPRCRINSRMRFACELLREKITDKQENKVYLTERKTNLFNALSASGVDCYGSEWLGQDKVSGVEYDGVRHEDIHHLTFADESFDVVMSLDVLEHVNDPVKAISELHRITKSGGLVIATFPFYGDREETVRRSTINEKGEVEYLQPAEYHGNPLGGGSLVFSELAWDFISSLRRVYEDNMRFINYWSIHGAHFGRPRFALLISK